MPLSPTPILQLYKIDSSVDVVDVATDFNNNCDKLEAQIPTMFIASRQPGNGDQTTVSGDNLVQWPNIDKANPTFVTPSGTGNSNFLLQSGLYSIKASCRLTANTDCALYFVTGSSATESTNFGFGPPTLAFNSCAGTADIAISTPTTISIVMWRGTSAASITNQGTRGTGLVITRLGPYN